MVLKTCKLVNSIQHIGRNQRCLIMKCSSPVSRVKLVDLVIIEKVYIRSWVRKGREVAPLVRIALWMLSSSSSSCLEISSASKLIVPMARAMEENTGISKIIRSNLCKTRNFKSTWNRKISLLIIRNLFSMEIIRKVLQKSTTKGKFLHLIPASQLWFNKTNPSSSTTW